MTYLLPKNINEQLHSRAETAELISTIEANLPDVELLVLFGSRAKGTTHAKSDWDIAVRCAPGTYTGIQIFSLQETLASLLHLPFDDIDLVNLRRCSPLLAFAIAREGIPLYQQNSATFHRFQVKSSKMYADTAKFRRLQRVYLGFEP